jgi:hypothetical protein
LGWRIVKSDLIGKAFLFGHKPKITEPLPETQDEQNIITSQLFPLSFRLKTTIVVYKRKKLR